MDRDTAIVISAIVITIIVFVALYFARRLFNKGTDAVENAIKRKRVENNPPQSENLAERLRTSSSDAARDETQNKL